MGDQYLPTLPPEFGHMTVNTADPRYQGVVEFARANGLTQAQFTALLGVEAKGVAARHAAAKPAPAQAPTPTAKPYNQMSFREKLAFAESRKAAR